MYLKNKDIDFLNKERRKVLEKRIQQSYGYADMVDFNSLSLEELEALQEITCGI